MLADVHLQFHFFLDLSLLHNGCFVGRLQFNHFLHVDHGTNEVIDVDLRQRQTLLGFRVVLDFVDRLLALQDAVVVQRVLQEQQCDISVDLREQGVDFFLGVCVVVAFAVAHFTRHEVFAILQVFCVGLGAFVEVFLEVLLVAQIFGVFEFLD